MRALVLALLTFASAASAEPLKTVFNPFTGKFDYITNVSSLTLPSGSTYYINNSTNPQFGGFQVEHATVTRHSMFGNNGGNRIDIDQFGRITSSLLGGLYVAPDGYAFRVVTPFDQIGIDFNSTYNGTCIKGFIGDAKSCFGVLGNASFVDISLDIGFGAAPSAASVGHGKILAVNGASWLLGPNTFGSTVKQTTITANGDLQMAAGSSTTFNGAHSFSTAAAAGGFTVPAMRFDENGTVIIGSGTSPSPQFRLWIASGTGSGAAGIGVNNFGQIRVHGPVPTFQNCAGGNTITGNSTMGRFDITGTTTNGCTLLFADKWQGAPECFVQCKNCLTAASRTSDVETSISSFTVNSAGLTSHAWSYWCGEAF